MARSSDPIITENNEMATMVETGFSNVDASRDAGNLVDYLGLAAKHLANHRRSGYEMLRLRPGAAVLDVGCGAGEVCVELAAMVAPSGRVARVRGERAHLDAHDRQSAQRNAPAAHVHARGCSGHRVADLRARVCIPRFRPPDRCHFKSGASMDLPPMRKAGLDSGRNRAHLGIRGGSAAGRETFRSERRGYLLV
jgi:hypothetical protein